MDFLKKYYKLITDPIHFPFGKEVEEIKINHNKNPKTIVKIFRKEKIEKYIKAIYLSKKLNKCDFVPKLIRYDDDKLEIEQVYCGKQAKIKDLPKDWKEQLIKIKKELIKQRVSFIDWGPWDVNPFVINNICIDNGKIYLIDLGDCDFDEPKNIEKYFDLQIYYFEQLIAFNKLFIIYFYFKNLYKGIYRKLSRPYNWIFLFIIYITYSM